MSEDRLNEIKRRPLFEDVPWLISEVERRRLDAVRAQGYMEGYSGDVVRLGVEVGRLTSLLSQSMAAHTIKDTTIATLRKALEIYEPETTERKPIVVLPDGQFQCMRCENIYDESKED